MLQDLVPWFDVLYDIVIKPLWRYTNLEVIFGLTLISISGLFAKGTVKQKSILVVVLFLSLFVAIRIIILAVNTDHIPTDIWSVNLLEIFVAGDTIILMLFLISLSYDKLGGL